MVFAPAGVNLILEAGAVLFIAPKIVEAIDTVSKVMDTSKKQESPKKEEEKK